MNDTEAIREPERHESIGISLSIGIPSLSPQLASESGIGGGRGLPANAWTTNGTTAWTDGSNYWTT